MTSPSDMSSSSSPFAVLSAPHGNVASILLASLLVLVITVFLVWILDKFQERTVLPNPVLSRGIQIGHYWSPITPTTGIVLKRVSSLPGGLLSPTGERAVKSLKHPSDQRGLTDLSKDRPMDLSTDLSASFRSRLFFPLRSPGLLQRLRRRSSAQFRRLLRLLRNLDGRRLHRHRQQEYQMQRVDQRTFADTNRLL